mgnify:FL=1
MNIADRRAAIALKAAERPDVRSLRSALDRVEQNFDDVMALQQEEILRLRRIVLMAVRAYRDMAANNWRGSRSRLERFTNAMDAICLESDAIEFSNDLPEKKRPVPKRG